MSLIGIPQDTLVHLLAYLRDQNSEQARLLVEEIRQRGQNVEDQRPELTDVVETGPK